MNDWLADIRDVDLEQYGFGVPVSLAFGGIVVLIGAIPGLSSFSSLTGYAQLGVLVMVLTTCALLTAAGYTYNELDASVWTMTREHDAVDPTED
jgi:hypothetical protein